MIQFSDQDKEDIAWLARRMQMNHLTGKGELKQGLAEAIKAAVELFVKDNK